MDMPNASLVAAKWVTLMAKSLTCRFCRHFAEYDGRDHCKTCGAPRGG